MSLINDLLSDLHDRDALPAEHEPLSGLHPVPRARVHRAWLLPAGAALFATSAWAVIAVDNSKHDVRSIDTPAHIVATHETADTISGAAEKTAVQTAAVAAKLSQMKPRLMLDNQLLSIARLGDAWEPDRTKGIKTTQVTPVTAAAKPVRAVATVDTTTAPPVVQPVKISTAPHTAVATEPVKPPTIRKANPLVTARAALADGRPQDAELHFQQLTTSKPGDTQAWLYLAQARSAQGRHADAEGALVTALTKANDPAPVARALARHLVTRNSIGEALKLLEAYRPKGRLEPDHDAFIAALHQRLGHHDAAAERYRGILAVRPQTAAWWVGLAISEEARGHAAAALDAYNHARNLGNLDPRLADYANRRISAMQGIGSS
ncbi:MAG: tetratricopeptide repeat protein [Gammaproteobacteria bacterium]|nr:tetratricopeptide repeat protein [Gammaproteobacteria bacterium]